MTNPTTRFRQSGSLVAGLLIGLAIVVATFAATDAAASAWPALLIFVAAAVLVLGLALQVVVTAAPRRRPAPRDGHRVLAGGLTPMVDAR
jgi:hypothetical protein